jgi:hypothetical protein
MLCSKIPVTYQQHQRPEINLFCLLSLPNEIWNNFLGKLSDNKKVFTLHKKIFRIIVDAKPQTPCRDLSERTASMRIYILIKLCYK